MRMILIQLLAFVACLAAFPARAEILYALSMHGSPKYAQDFDHLDYANPDAPKGGILRQAAIGSYDSLNPFAIKGKAAQGLSNVHDRLLTRVWDEPFTLYPTIAEKVDVPADRSSITFFLDPRATFQDGSPITADDVMFTFETLREHGRPNMRRVYKLVKTVEKIDDRTVHFALGEGYDRETIMILAIMPVLSKAWWAGREFDSASLDIPIASGPYKIAAIDPGRKITYQRDPHYWAADLPVNRGHYNFDTIVFDYYRDDTVAFEAFKAGQLDLRREWDANKWAKGYDIPAVKSGRNGSVSHFPVRLVFCYLYLCPKTPP
jgi:ABC-type oligopeptide transport system substrate-binding subunit